ncbi:hypothetical protein AMAG_20498 [Allomyces macrogynus ATCC 38327]|uniref:G-protein coupled receptors family 3 profile domain-containing protein n=1 Tax=Allomyces macrogynus (strain ATCC 38327) TaxID=578462 RepID=A0A0L0TDC7_ALLM3|nr:hypothetical protein AMAG_20498 [Allomyces macrogynus ATCC 38327]|eukprot:KNE72675.1 hypothetical protein AMAG_20498 [Allomyces macrogynus ATCC 38327]
MSIDAQFQFSSIANATLRFPGNRTTIPPWHPTFLVDVPDYSQPGVMVTLVVAGILVMVTLAAWAMFVVYRRSKRVRHHGLPIVSTLCFSIALALTTPFFAAGNPTVVTCNAQWATIVVGFGLTMASLAIRSYRIAKVLDNRVLAKSQSLGTRSLMARMLALPLVQVVLLAIAYVVAPLVPAKTVANSLVVVSCAIPSGSVNRILSGGAAGLDLYLLTLSRVVRLDEWVPVTRLDLTAIEFPRPRKTKATGTGAKGKGATPAKGGRVANKGGAATNKGGAATRSGGSSVKRKASAMDLDTPVPAARRSVAPKGGRSTPTPLGNVDSDSDSDAASSLPAHEAMDEVGVVTLTPDRGGMPHAREGTVDSHALHDDGMSVTTADPATTVNGDSQQPGFSKSAEREKLRTGRVDDAVRVGDLARQET